MASREAFSVEGFTNLPEVAKLVQNALNQISASLGKDMPTIQLGKADFTGLEQLQRRVSEVISQTEGRLATLQAREAKTPGGTYRIDGMQGSAEQLRQRFANQAVADVIGAASTFRTSGPEIMRALPMGQIVETMLSSALPGIAGQISNSPTLMSFRDAINSDVMGRFGMTLQRSTGSIAFPRGAEVQDIGPLRDALFKAIEPLRLNALASQGVASGQMFAVGRTGAAYDPATGMFIDKYASATGATAVQSKDRLRRLEEAWGAQLAAEKDLEAKTRGLANGRQLATAILQPGATDAISRNLRRDAYGSFYELSGRGDKRVASRLTDPNAIAEAEEAYSTWLRAKTDRENARYQRQQTQQKRQDAEADRLAAAEQKLAVQTEVRAQGLKRYGGVVNVPTAFGPIDPATGMPKYAPGLYNRAGQAANPEQVNEWANKLGQALRKETEAAEKAAVEQEALARNIRNLHGYYNMEQPFAGPNGRMMPAGLYSASTGQIATGLQERDWNARTGQTFFGSMIGSATGRGISSGGQGLDPNWLSNLGATAGSVMRYSVTYQALFGLAAVFRDTLQEAKNMSDSMRDLNVAMGGTNDASQSFINNLSEISRLAGSNVGEAMDAAARGVRMFTDSMMDTDQIERVGESVAMAATQISLITSKTLPDSVGDITAVASAFGMSAESVSTIVDAVSGAKNVIGGDPKQVSQGLANIAQSASEAGLSLQEAAAAIALVQGRTDQSGQAVATRLSRVFSILSGTTGRGVITRINQSLGLTGEDAIDADATVRDQFVKIAAAYQKATPQLQGLIRSQLGGPSNSRELIPLLTNPEKVFDKQALDEAMRPGRGMEEFQMKSTDLVGTLRKIQGSISNIQTGLVQSDIFAPFAIGLKILEPTLNAMDRLLKLYNELMAALSKLPVVGAIPGGASGIVAITVEMALLRKAFAALGGLQAFSGLKDKVLGPLFGAFSRTATEVERGGASVSVALKNAAMRIQGAGVESGFMASVRATPGAVKGAGVGAALGRAGSGLLSLVGGVPGLAVGAAIGGVLLADGVRQANQEILDARKLIDDTIKREGPLTAEDAGALRTAAANLEQMQGGPSSFIVQGARERAVKELQATADGWDEIFKVIADEREKVAKSAQQDFTTFGDPAMLTLDSLNARLEELSIKGETAGTTLGFINDLLNSLGKPRSEVVAPTEAVYGVAQSLNPDMLDFTTPAAKKAGVTSALDQIKRAWEVTGDPMMASDLSKVFPGATSMDQVSLTPIEDMLAEMIKSPNFSEDMGKKLGRFFNLGRDLTDAEQEAARGILQQGILDSSTIDDTMNPALANAGAAMIVDYFMRQLFGPTGAVKISVDEAAKLAQEQLARLSTQLSQQHSPSGRLAVLREALKAAQNNARNNPGIPALMETVQDIEFQTYEEENKRINALAKARAGRASTRKQGNAILESALTRLAIRGAKEGDVDGLVTLFNSANKKQIDTIVADARDRASKAREDYEKMKDVPGVGDIMRAAWLARKAELKALAAALGLTDAPKTGGDYVIDGDSASMTVAEARRAANAARLGGQIAPAVAELQNAKEALAKAKGHGVKYYQALADLYRAQEQYADALRQYQDTQYRLGIDTTDPIAMAKAELRKARKKLQDDLNSGKGKDVIASDQLEVRNQENALEQTKFSERLQRVQTNEQLGRISHAAYIKYLDNEHHRLAAIAHRTRQQQNQLDQIDQALKAAREATNAQFNLGDIKVPTPYEVRRYIKSQGAYQGAAAGAGNQTVINIDGTDTALVLDVVSRYLGTSTLQTASVSVRKG